MEYGWTWNGPHPDLHLFFRKACIFKVDRLDIVHHLLQVLVFIINICHFATKPWRKLMNQHGCVRPNKTPFANYRHQGAGARCRTLDDGIHRNRTLLNDIDGMECRKNTTSVGVKAVFKARQGNTRLNSVNMFLFIASKQMQIQSKLKTMPLRHILQVYWSRRHVDLGVWTLQFLEVFLQS